MSKQSIGSLCEELGLKSGKNSDVDYLLFSCNVPAHKDNLIALGFDPSIKPTKRLIPFSAYNYIVQYVFGNNIPKVVGFNPDSVN